MYSDINFVALLAAAIGAMVVGFLWYGPLFGKTWMKLTGKSEAELKTGNANQMYALSSAVALVEAYVLSVFLGYAGATTVVAAVQVAFWAWLGFIATTMGVNYMFGGKSMNLFLIDSLHHLVAAAVMAVVLVSL